LFKKKTTDLLTKKHTHTCEISGFCRIVVETFVLCFLTSWKNKDHIFSYLKQATRHFSHTWTTLNLWRQARRPTTFID